MEEGGRAGAQRLKHKRRGRSPNSVATSTISRAQEKWVVLLQGGCRKERGGS